MNIKITKEQYERLCNLDYKEYLFGSQLHGIANKNSDYDYIRVISDDFYQSFTSLAVYLPNIHSWQYDGENNTQYVWMTEKQFYHNLFSGDGNMISDVVLLSGEFENSLFLCQTYKIIKGYIGVAKRDLKLHGNNEKKRFHALRSLYMADELMDNELPTVEKIKLLYKNYSGVNLPSKEYLVKKEQELRNRLNEMLDKGEIDMYPKFKEENELVQIMMNSNNIREFKY
jgi:predicted nucleotidyltransferase